MKRIRRTIFLMAVSFTTAWLAHMWWQRSGLLFPVWMDGRFYQVQPREALREAAETPPDRNPFDYGKLREEIETSQLEIQRIARESRSSQKGLESEQLLARELGLYDLVDSIEFESVPVQQFRQERAWDPGSVWLEQMSKARATLQREFMPAPPPVFDL